MPRLYVTLPCPQSECLRSPTDDTVRSRFVRLTEHFVGGKPEIPGGNTVPDQPKSTPNTTSHLTVVFRDDDTAAHALRLTVSGKKKKGCPDLSISCKPQLYSCEPVAQCASYDIPAPGCSPLECSPVSTSPST
jgi:hypothetical protein